MNSLSLGPLVLSGERFAIIAGVVVFMIGSSILVSRISGRFNLWSTVVAIGGVAVARLAHVVANWAYFSGDPMRAFAVWQGGFAWLWVLPFIALATFLLLKTRQERAWAIAPVAAAALVWVTTHQLASATEPLPPAELTLVQLEGPPIDLAQSINRPTVINIWATWCPPCRREMPALAQAEQSHPGIRFLFINQGESRETVHDYLAREGLSLRHVLLDTGMALPRHYRTVGIPVTLFLHADGTLAKAHMGEIAPEQVAAEVARLNKASPAALSVT